ncbi:hypothetical protein NPIL_665261, partial [Nephila pilipes]
MLLAGTFAGGCAACQQGCTLAKAKFYGSSQAEKVQAGMGHGFACFVLCLPFK